MKAWCITNKYGVFMGMLTRIRSITTILRSLYSETCSFELEEDGASALVFRVKDSHAPKWDDRVEVRATEIGNADFVLWSVSDGSGRTLGLIPPDISMVEYIRLWYIDRECLVIHLDDEIDLQIFEVRFLDSDGGCDRVIARKITFKSR